MRVERRRPIRIGWLVGASVLVGAIDVAIGLAGEPTTVPYAGVWLPLLVSLSLPLLHVVPRAVVGLVVVAAALMAVSDTFAPGLLVPAVQLSPATVPRVTAIVIIWLVLTERARVAYPVVALLGILAARIWAPAWDATPLGLLATVLPAVGALYFDARARLLRSLRERAERAERERELIAETVRADERRRLAMEMHDVVTHRLSAMVLHASALGATSSDPGTTRAAEQMRESGTAALGELRDLVGILREGTAEARPTARDSVAPVGEIADLLRGPGLEDAALDLDGDDADVSPTVARTAYRVVQEAVTNVRKHAPGARVAVRIRYRPDRVEVRVENAAAECPADPTLTGTGSGRGLEGLTQRVELVGGTLRAGPTGDGGFAVDATLPSYVPSR